VPGYFIRIYTSYRFLELYEGNKLVYSFPIGIGKAETPTPHGHFEIINKRVNPGGIYGARWMGISLDNYGIHGTNDPSSISQARSLGCIRLYNQDVEALFRKVVIGTPVHITS